MSLRRQGWATWERCAKYVITNDYDAPVPSNVCQLVPGVGYCYLDRNGTKPQYDGMNGAKATPIKAFGFDWRETDRTVCFELTSHDCTATYSDGTRRCWQSAVGFFEYRRLGVRVELTGK